MLRSGLAAGRYSASHVIFTPVETRLPLAIANINPKYLDKTPHRLETSATSRLHTSAVLDRRLGKRVREMPQWKAEKFAKGPWYKRPEIEMKSILTKTIHPENRFASLEDAELTRIKASSAADLPVSEMEDPYQQESKMCVLCPRRYATPLVPNYKNPKLLSQFISPHTGKVYQSHITGLCQHMQEKVEKEVLRAHAAGFLSTHVKDPLYLKDPSLFNPSRPVKPNPF